MEKMRKERAIKKFLGVKSLKTEGLFAVSNML